MLPGHPQETELVTRTPEHICHLYEVPISTSKTTKFWKSPFPLNPAYITYLEKENTRTPQCQLEPDSWLGQALAQVPEDCNSTEGVFQRQGHLKLLNMELSLWFRRGSSGCKMRRIRSLPSIAGQCCGLLLLGLQHKLQNETVQLTAGPQISNNLRVSLCSLNQEHV